jgi:hypothetical protein
MLLEQQRECPVPGAPKAPQSTDFWRPALGSPKQAAVEAKEVVTALGEGVQILAQSTASVSVSPRRPRSKPAISSAIPAL